VLTTVYARVTAQAHLRKLRILLATSTHRNSVTDGSDAVEHETAVDSLLFRASELLGDDEPVGRWRVGPRRSWARLEQAWQYLHVAEESLLIIAPDEVIDGQIHELIVQGAKYLGPEDARVQYLTDWEAASRSADGFPRVSPTDRHTMASLLHAVHHESDYAYARMRSFWHMVLVASLLLSLATACLLVATTLHPAVIPLCSTGREMVHGSICPTGQTAPSGGDAVLVAFIGAIAAGMSAVAAVSKLGPTIDPYSSPLAQSLLKIPLGCLTAVLGVMTLERGLDVGAGLPTSQGGILFVAFVFGYSQELLTRIVDARGAQIRGMLDGRTSAGSRIPQVPRHYSRRGGPPAKQVGSHIPSSRGALDPHGQASSKE
jgi:hypothetical protein